MKNTIVNFYQIAVGFTRLDLLELASLVGTSILVITFFIFCIIRLFVLFCQFNNPLMIYLLLFKAKIVVAGN